MRSRKLEKEGLTTRLNECGCQTSDDELLPELVLGRSNHELVELSRRVEYADLVVDDLVVDVVGCEELPEIESVRLLQELWGWISTRGSATTTRLTLISLV